MSPVEQARGIASPFLFLLHERNVAFWSKEPARTGLAVLEMHPGLTLFAPERRAGVPKNI
jgi:hypothetical protein